MRISDWSSDVCSSELGVERLSVDLLGEAARRGRDLGIPCLALYPNTPRELRTDDGREALNPDNLMCRAIKAIKDAAPDIGVLTDVALDQIGRASCRERVCQYV